MGRGSGTATLEISSVTPRKATGRVSRRPPGRRDELLAAALDVLRRIGPGASMDEMAAEAGITKPVLYRYFGDRHGLIAAVADRYSDGLVARLDRALAGAPREDAEVLIRVPIESYVTFIEEDPVLYSFLTQQAPPGSLAFIAVIDRVTESITKVIRDVFEAAGLDTRPARTWAQGVVGTIHLVGSEWARRPDVPRDQLVADLVALVAHGLIGASVPSQDQ